jgi:hypothetical protein
MPRRRGEAPFGYTVDGKPRTRRPAAVGAEFRRLAALAVKVMMRAGDAGMTRSKIATAIGTNSNVVEQILMPLKVARRVHVSGWVYGYPAYALGDKPNVPKPASLPAPPVAKKQAKVEDDAEKQAAAEISRAHAKWAETWIPHPDPAAAWIGRAA